MVNLGFLEKFTKGDSKKMKRYINMYLSIAPETFDKMEINIRDAEWDQLRINAHSLKPQSDYMGVPLLKDVLVEIENNATFADPDLLEDLYQKAKTLNNQAMEKLSEYVAGL